MANFFKQLQSMMLNREKEHIATLIPYYETLWQHKDKFKDMIEEIESYPEVDIQYISNKEEYYTDGVLKIFLFTEKNNWMSQPNFYYEIELRHDRRSLGYCICSPDDEGYVASKNCCGVECDWIAPSFNVRKVTHIAFASFNGVERDLWKLEEKWEESLAEHNEKLKQERLKRLEVQLESTKREIELLKNHNQI